MKAKTAAVCQVALAYVIHERGLVAETVTIVIDQRDLLPASIMQFICVSDPVSSCRAGMGRISIRPQRHTAHGGKSPIAN